MKHFKNDPHVLKHWQKQLISMMIVVKHYKTDLLLWNTDKTTCTLENTTENGSLSSVWHYRVVLEISRVMKVPFSVKKIFNFTVPLRSNFYREGTLTSCVLKQQ